MRAKILCEFIVCTLGATSHLHRILLKCRHVIHHPLRNALTLCRSLFRFSELGVGGDITVKCTFGTPVSEHLSSCIAPSLWRVQRTVWIYHPFLISLHYYYYYHYHHHYYYCYCFFFFLLLFFHWHYSSLWALACRTMSFHVSLSATNSLHLLTPIT